MNPFHLFIIYFKTVKENYKQDKIPGLEKVYHFLIPLIVSIILIFLIEKKGLSDTAINFLITVHGILISVLMASFTPFIEKLDYKAKNEKTFTEEEKEFYSNLRIAKKIVFSANSLAIFISILVIVLLLITKIVDKTEDLKAVIFEQSVNFCFIYYGFYIALFYLISLNGILIIRTVHLLSDIVMKRIDEGD